MIVHRRAPDLWVFGVEDHAVQLTWRLLQPGTLHLRVLDTDVAARVETDGSPGVLLLTGLPSSRLLTIEASGSALVEPQLLKARTLPALGGEELARFATLSDLHVGTHVFGHRGGIREPEPHERAHPHRCAEAAIDELTTWGASHLVVKGDLTNVALPHQWREYKEITSRAQMPVDAIPGNHDHSPYNRSASLLPTEAAAAFDLSIALPILTRDLPGIRLILVDSTLPGQNGGTVHHCRSDILDAAADAPRSGGVMVILHHQLQPHRIQEGWPTGVPHAESLSFLDDLGRAHPHAFVTSGHTHRHRRWGRSSVVVTQVGSTKDYPGVWAGYVVHEGGLRQIVRRVSRPDCVAWTDHSRTAAYGLWEHTAPGRLDARCFNVPWSTSAG